VERVYCLNLGGSERAEYPRIVVNCSRIVVV
jgi:hypothetical protein